MISKAYFILTGICTSTNKREMIFSDFNKQTVIQERKDTSRTLYKYLKVRKVKDSSQASIDRLLNSLPVHV